MARVSMCELCFCGRTGVRMQHGRPRLEETSCLGCTPSPPIKRTPLCPSFQLALARLSHVAPLSRGKTSFARSQ